MKTIPRFSDAAAAAAIELVEQLEPDDQQRVADAMAAGAKLAVAMLSDAHGGATVALELIDRHGTVHRLVSVGALAPTRQ